MPTRRKFATQVNLSDVLVIHADQITAYGGAAGMRDRRPSGACVTDLAEETAAVLATASA